jgi:hypothetical protein
MIHGASAVVVHRLPTDSAPSFGIERSSDSVGGIAYRANVSSCSFDALGNNSTFYRPTGMSGAFVFWPFGRTFFRRPDAGAAFTVGNVRGLSS